MTDADWEILALQLTIDKLRENYDCVERCWWNEVKLRREKEEEVRKARKMLHEAAGIL